MNENSKYRIFDQKNNKMVYNVWELNNICHPVIAINCDFSTMRGEFEILPIIISDENQLMRSIGLEDKNKEEIYDGDIIQLKCGDEFFNCLVEYDINKASFSLIHPAGYHGEFGISKGIINTCDEFKIIGNIHENKELLENNDEQR